MIDVKAFEITDLDSFDSKFEYENLERDMKRNILDDRMMIMTLIKSGKSLAICGVTEFREKMGELWLLPSKDVDNNKYAFFKSINFLIWGFLFRELRYRRLEIAIMDGWEKGRKWAEKLGFEYSHICDGYDSNYTDHIIYKKVVKWQQAQQ